MHIKTIIDNYLSAEENMQKDLDLFTLSEEKNLAFLRFYSWDNNYLTFGCNQKNINSLFTNPYAVKRPTGGGVVNHQKGDFTWSLCLPLSCFRNNNLMHIYLSLSEIYKQAIQQEGIECFINKNNQKNLKTKSIVPYCLEFSARYEIVNQQGEKILGSAQKKGKNSLLQQNNLFISLHHKEHFINNLTKSLNAKF